MEIRPSALLLELVEGERGVVSKRVDERPLSALLAAALNESPRLASECCSLPVGQVFRDGTNGEPDVLGYGSDGRATSLIEVKTGLSNFNWSDGRDQLTRYRELNDVDLRHNRLLVLPASRAEKIRMGIDQGRIAANTPGSEISRNWRMLAWEDIANWLSDNEMRDTRVKSVSSVVKILLRVR